MLIARNAHVQTVYKKKGKGKKRTSIQIFCSVFLKHWNNYSKKGPLEYTETLHHPEGSQAYQFLSIGMFKICCILQRTLLVVVDVNLVTPGGVI